MKTTIDLPDELADRAKEVARSHQLTLRELVTEGLRHEIDRMSEPSARAEFRFKTRGGSGLQEGVSPDSLIARAYDLPS